MKNDFKNEKWSLVKPPFRFTNNLKIEVSNFGRVRTSTKIAENRVLKGTLINGYPIVRFKLFKKRADDAQKQLDQKRRKIEQLTGKLRDVKSELKSYKKNSPAYNSNKKKVDNVAAELSTLKEVYRNVFRKDELERTINYAPLVHRLVADSFVKQPSKKHDIVAHLDYNKSNNHFSNLKWMTQEDNIEHQKKSPVVIKEKKKRIGKRPENASGYKLNEKKVAEIKKRIQKGETLSKISDRFNVSETQLLRIKRGINWGDVKVPH
ncbi:MAG TPA: HNH endonuclease [Bacteroidia bacterium]|mgnify:FL=1|nr:HNH endonuclease [Bacteroidia bacterium]QQR95451.1 MAG: HNH endonuclease [Bacteroidota bacterium]MBP7714985.1 HNH endonuclease [Bacteroidia bacterium]MBP8668030.1 HNH endonuclease [Bacteroidia bacterium]HOZ81977.1 HNH endonuclease [Bacteroidia bacterium]